MAIGELVARLLCDSSNFDRNIERSQREVQEFRRRTEREAAAVNNAFRNIGDYVDIISPRLGNIISSLGKMSAAIAIGTVAFEGFKQVIQQSESAMDKLEEDTARLNGAWEHITTTISNGNIFNGMVSSLRESVRLAGELQNIIDDLGTLGGYHKLNTSEVETNLSYLKELYKSGASKEEINKQIKKTKASIVRFDTTSAKIENNLKLEFDNLLEGLYEEVKREGRVGLKAGTHFIDKFATDTNWRDSIISWSTYLGKFKNFFGVKSESALSPLKTDKSFEEFLKKSKIYDSYLFKAFKEGKSEGYEYIKDVISLVRGTVDKKEDSEYGIVNIQNAKTAWLNAEREKSEMHNSFYKQYNDIVGKPVKGGGGGSVYSSKQEAPKERTLQDILDDLNKSLAWNKYLAQNLGEDVTGLNISTLEKAVNELMDLLKNTTDEKSKSEIVNIIKSLNDRAGLIAVNSTKSLNKQDKNEEDYVNSYDVKSAFYDLSAIQAEGIIYSLENKINYGKEFKPLLKSMIEKFKERGLTINFDVENLSDEKLLKASNWDAEKFFKDNGSYSIDTSVNRERMSEEEKLNELNIELGKFKDVISDVILAAETSYNLRKGNIRNLLSRSSFDGGDTYLDSKLLAESNNFGGLDSPVFGYSVLSNTYLSNMDTIRRKYTGFSKFQSDFNKYAHINFLKSNNDPNFDTKHILPLIYDAYSKALSDNPNAPKFYKSVKDIIKDNPLYDEQHPHKELKEKVKEILNKKNVSLSALDELKNIDKGDISNKIESGYLDLYKEDKLSDILNDAKISSPFNRAELIKLLLLKLNSLRKNRVEAYQNIDDEVNINQKTLDLDNYKKIQEALALLIKEKKKEITEEELKRLNELRNDSGVGAIIKGNESQTEDTINDIITEYGNKVQETVKKIDNANKTKEKITDEINEVDKAIDNTIDAQRSNDKLVERAEQYKKISNNMYEISIAASQMGSAFSSLGGELGDVAGSIFNIIGITAEAIGKILGMATAEGTLSAMKLPWPKNLVAVATVVAAGASIAGQVKGMASKKYATGGIVSGPGTGISDSIPIRVSNGEMILNHRQQSNLFNLLDKGSGTEGKIEFKNKLVGSDIIGSATTYNKRRNLIL